MPPRDGYLPSHSTLQTQDTLIHYEIHVKGYLGQNAATWFPDLTISLTPDGETIISGPVADQSALHGILMRICDLGLTLTFVRRMEDKR